MSKKKKMEQQQKNNQFVARLDDVAQQKINGEEEKMETKGLMETIRDARPKFEPSKEDLESTFEATKPVAKPEPEPEPKSETVSKPTEEGEKPETETPPAWATELVKSQKSFQESVKSTFLKAGKALDQHEKKLDSLEGRIKNLEDWKETAMEAERAKAEVKAKAEEDEGVKPASEPEPESEPTSTPEPTSAPEPTPDPDPIKVDPKKKEILYSASELHPVMWWRGRIIGEDESVSYSVPVRNIFVANQFATIDNDVVPFFGWANPKGEIQREMTTEELEKYGKYF